MLRAYQQNRSNPVLASLVVSLGIFLQACGGSDGGTTTTTVEKAPPGFNSGTAISVEENATDTGYTAVASNTDSDTFNYSLTGGTDQDAFSIDTDSGALSFNTAPDYEAPADSDGNNIYIVEITATEGTTPISQSLVVSVTNLNDNSPVFTSGAAGNADENTTTTDYIAMATDADGDAVTYSLSGGADQAAFSIDADSGSLSLLSAPDFETPVDANGNNFFELEITATDGANPVVQNLSVRLIDIFNENRPIFNKPTVINLDENIAALNFTANATDADDETLFYTLSGGLDQDKFTIDSSTGVLNIVSAVDFENPIDSNGDNILHVEITATDNYNPVELVLTVNIVDIIEVTPTATGIKTIQLDWSAYSGATHYKLFTNPDGATGFNLVKDNIPGDATSTTFQVPLHLTDWVNVDYMLEAHDVTGKLQGSYPIDITPFLFERIGFLKASNSDADDYFGLSVSLSGDGNTMAVGAPVEASNATGISTDGSGEADNSAIGFGAVYVFNRSGGNWVQQAYVKASNAEAEDLFGTSLDLSHDGNTLAVGAVGEASNATGISANGSGEADNSAAASGAVYVFSRSGGSWTQQAYVKASNADAGDEFGSRVELSDDGSTLAVGAWKEDSNATGISTDGSGEADNSAASSGAVYVFSRSGDNWAQQAWVKASNAEAGDEFGSSLGLSANGNTLVVGAQREASNATGISTDGSGEADNSALDAGAVYVFSRSGSNWAQQAYVKSSINTLFTLNKGFGGSLALSADGNTLATGWPGVFASYVSNANSVTGVIDDGSEVGGEFSGGSFPTGAVYLFSRSGGSWAQQAYIKANNPDQREYFGISLDLSADGKTLAVGAPGEDSNATGVSADGSGELDNSAPRSGAVYVYSRTGDLWRWKTFVKASNASDEFGGDVENLPASFITSTQISLSADGGTLAVSSIQEGSKSGSVYLY